MLQKLIMGILIIMTIALHIHETLGLFLLIKRHTLPLI